MKVKNIGFQVTLIGVFLAGANSFGQDTTTQASQDESGEATATTDEQTGTWQQPLFWRYGGTSILPGYQDPLEAGIDLFAPRPGYVVITADENGQASVYVDGASVTADRIEIIDGSFRVMSENGEVVVSMHTIDETNSVVPPGGALYWPLPGPPPRATVGVTVSAVEPALASHLSVEAEAVVRVAEVKPDGAAAQAGIQVHDVIVAINGKAPATNERLRKVLEQTIPGETLTLELIRQGQRTSVTFATHAEPGHSYILPTHATWMTGLYTQTVPWATFDRSLDLTIVPTYLPTLVPNVSEYSVDLAVAQQPGEPEPSRADPQVDLTNRVQSIEQRLERIEKLERTLLEKLEQLLDRN